MRGIAAAEGRLATPSRIFHFPRKTLGADAVHRRDSPTTANFTTEPVMNVSRLTILSLSSLSLLAVVACGKPSGKDGASTTDVTSANAPKGGSCLEDKSGICTEYSDNPLGFAEVACKDMYKGTYQKTSCPTANLIGTCQRKAEKDGKPGDKEFYYFGNGKAAWTDDAKEDCEKNPLLPGTFSAQAGNEQ